jgi:hypothetical protein
MGTTLGVIMYMMAHVKLKQEFLKMGQPFLLYVVISLVHNVMFTRCLSPSCPDHHFPAILSVDLYVLMED